MRLMRTAKLLSTMFLFTSVLIAPPLEADDFTVGLKSFYASRSTDNLEDDEAFFDPGIYLAWDITDRFWVSTAYLGGAVDFIISGSTTAGTIEEVDSDIVFGWRMKSIDLGVGYRITDFTTTVFDLSTATKSAGPMLYLGGGSGFGRSAWGYYWGTAYMFDDLEDDDGAQEHFNGEAGLRWASKQGLSILLGYRYKEYSGDGAGGLSFSGLAFSLGYTFLSK